MDPLMHSTIDIRDCRYQWLALLSYPYVSILADFQDIFSIPPGFPSGFQLEFLEIVHLGPFSRRIQKNKQKENPSKQWRAWNRRLRRQCGPLITQA